MTNPDRDIDLQEQIDGFIRDKEAALNEAGYSAAEVQGAFESVIRNRRIANDLDPDPADDPA